MEVPCKGVNLGWQRIEKTKRKMIYYLYNKAQRHSCNEQKDSVHRSGIRRVFRTNRYAVHGVIRK